MKNEKQLEHYRTRDEWECDYTPYSLPVTLASIIAGVMFLLIIVSSILTLILIAVGTISWLWVFLLPPSLFIFHRIKENMDYYWEHGL
jgi:hypothetical protein